MFKKGQSSPAATYAISTEQQTMQIITLDTILKNCIFT